MRGEVKRFKKVSKLEAQYRSDGSPKTSSSPPLLPFGRFHSGKKKEWKKKNKKIRKKRKEGRKKKERGGEEKGKKKKETRRNETRNDSITWQDFKSSNAKRIFFTMSRGTWTRSVVPRYSKLCNAIATAQSDINFNGPERRHLWKWVSLISHESKIMLSPPRSSYSLFLFF